jgi:tol-pal system protein YbgF
MMAGLNSHKKGWVTLIILLLGVVACTTKVTPVTMGQRAAFFTAKEVGARHSGFIYRVDQTIAGCQKCLWYSFKDRVAPSGSPLPPLEYASSDSKGRHVDVSDNLVSRPDELLYEEGMGPLRERRFSYALDKFTLLVELYPHSELADNALYWAGECCYVQNLPGEALHFFRRVVREYPMGNKVPDALLKMAYLYFSQGEREEGLRLLRDLTSRYPHHPVAEKALVRLSLAKGRVAYY